MTAESPLRVACRPGSAYHHVAYSQSVLQEIRRRATDQFLAIPRGGLEVGGVLYGTRANGCATILAQREIPLEYLTGPSFLLSPRDEEQLTAILDSAAPADPDGQDLEILGWWHSHTRSDVSLKEPDLNLHQRFFGTAGALALVVRPFKFEPAQVAIYAPNEDRYQACCGFTLEDPAAAKLVQAAPVAPAAVSASAATPARVAAVAAVADAPAPRSRVYVIAGGASETRRTGTRWSGAVAVCALACVAAAAFFLLQPRRTPEPVNLDVTDTPNGLLVRWNADATETSDVSSAELLITDGPGEPRAVALRPDDLRTGAITYARQSERVEVRLRVRSDRGAAREVVAHFIGATPVPASARPVFAESREQEPSPEVNRLQEELRRLNTEVRRLQSAPPSAAANPPRLKTPSVSERSRVTTASLTPRRIASTPDIVLAAPAPLNLPAQAPSVPVLAPLAIPPAPAPAAAAKPARGRAIWTGKLERGATLLIDSRRASMGDLTGRMPARECRVRIYAGELRESGLVVYTPTGPERVEPPGEANGWNLTMFRPDPRRFRELSVIEAPNQSNGWQRLMVRSDRPVSVMLIDWEEIAK